MNVFTSRSDRSRSRTKNRPRLESLEGLEFVSDFRPEDLPTLLADCTVGAFPSYVEGFGLAVLEQLASGLPTVAYDTAGPRDLLASRLPDLLVPKGDDGLVHDGTAAARTYPTPDDFRIRR